MSLSLVEVRGIKLKLIFCRMQAIPFLDREMAVKIYFLAFSEFLDANLAHRKEIIVDIVMHHTVPSNT